MEVYFGDEANLIGYSAMPRRSATWDYDIIFRDGQVYYSGKSSDGAVFNIEPKVPGLKLSEIRLFRLRLYVTTNMHLWLDNLTMDLAGGRDHSSEQTPEPQTSLTSRGVVAPGAGLRTYQPNETPVIPAAPAATPNDQKLNIRDMTTYGGIRSAIERAQGGPRRPDYSMIPRDVFNNIRQLSAASDQYFLENGVNVVEISNLVGPTNYIRELHSIQGERYPAVIKQGSPFIVIAADGTPWVYEQ
jgi:hypothetical protein